MANSLQKYLDGIVVEVPANTVQYARVAFDTATSSNGCNFKVRLAGATEVGMGIIYFPHTDVNQTTYWTGTLFSFLRPGTTTMVASGAITKGATVYAAANGKVSASGTIPVGYAIDAASGDGKELSVMSTASAVTMDSTTITKAAAVAPTSSTLSATNGGTAATALTLTAGTALTDNSGGTASTTLAAAAGDSYTKAEIDNLVASLASVINQLIADNKVMVATLIAQLNAEKTDVAAVISALQTANLMNTN